MTLRICSYNIEWLDNLFDSDNTFAHPSDAEEQQKIQKRLDAIETVLMTVQADLVGIIEVPNHVKSGTKRTVACLEHMAAELNLTTRKAVIGFPSAGRQEIAILFDPDKVTAQHDPGGTGGKKNPRFNILFEDDADGDGIKEIYRHYRPPLEAEVTRNDGGDGFGLLVVHTKSKGIFDNTDWIHWQRTSERNRRKLFAECRSIRRRVDEWLDDGRRLVVMGDVNDGPGMDMTESLFGRSAVEILLGEIFEPERLLKSYTGRPRWGAYGWEPSSASFRDSFTHDWVNVLIDHVLISQQIPVHGAAPHKVWNPWQLDEATPIKTALLAASDHFPVTLDLA